MATACNLSEKYPSEKIIKTLNNFIRYNSEKWNENPYEIVYNFKQRLQSISGSFNDEWFNQEMENAFKTISGSSYDPEILSAYEHSLNDQKSALFNKFLYKDNLSELFKKSTSLQQFAINKFNVLLTSAKFVDFNNKIFIKSNDDLNTSIINLKNKLFNNLKNYVQSDSQENLFNEEGVVNSELYTNIMTELSNNPEFNKESFSGLLTDFTKTNFADPYTNFLILHNFDSFLKEYFSGIISINQNYFGSLNNPTDNYKYMIADKGNETNYWMKENENAHDPTLVSSPAIKKIADTIPLYDANNKLIKDSYLGLDKILSLAGKIKSYELTHNIDSFRSNPRKLLLQYLDNNFNGLGEFEEYRSHIYTLKNYIDKIIEVEENDNNFGDISNKPDIISMIAWEIDKSFSPIYIKYGNSTVQLNMSEFENTTKILRDNSISQIIKLKANNYTLLKGADFSEDNIRNTIIKININLGTNINIDSLLYYAKLTNPSKKIENLSDARYILTKSFNNIFELIKSDFNQIKNQAKDNNYTLIDNILSKSNDFNNLLKVTLKSIRIDTLNILRKENGDPIPVNRIVSLGGNDKESIQQFKLNKNIIKDNLGFLKGTGLRMEAVTEFVPEGKDASTFNTTETTFSSFFGEFIDQYINGQFITQPVSYSDKPSKFLKIFDLSKIKENSQELTNDYLIKKYFEQNNVYFNRALNKVITDLSIIIPDVTLTNDLDKNKDIINNKLHNLSTQQLYNLSKGKNIEIVKDFHFSEYKEGLRLNRSLINYELVSRNIDNFTTWNKLNSINFFNGLKRNNLDLIKNKLFFDKIDNIKDIVGEEYFGDPKTEEGKFFKYITGNDSKYINNLYTKIGITDRSVLQDKKYLATLTDDQRKEIVKINKIATDLLAGKKILDVVLYKLNGESYYDFDNLDELNKTIIDGKSIIEINPLFEKYVTLSNMTKDAYLSITTQFPYLYGGAKSIDTKLDLEESEGFNKMSKRMVNHTASIQNYVQGLDNGISSTMKIAVVYDPKATLFNYMGNTPGKKWHNQDIEDGSARGCPFMTKLEENSLPGLGQKGTQKPFWASIKPFITEESKFAKFPLTNYTIRNSMGSDRPEIVMMEKMTNLQWIGEDKNYLNIDLTRNYKDEVLTINNIKNSLNLRDIYFVKDGKYYKINSLKRISYNKETGSNYNVNISPVDINGNEFKNDQNSIITENYQTPINSLFELYNVFGGFNSMELKNGKLDWSESVMDIVTKYIVNVGTTTDNGIKKDFPLKNFMIGAIIRTSAQKVGQNNVNSIDVEKRGNKDTLNYYESSTANFGVQLDAGHQADESDMTEPTQVITALSALGYTTQITQETYHDIAAVMQDSLKEPMKYLNADGTEAKTDDEKAAAEQALNEASKVDKSGKTAYDYLSEWIINEFKHAQVIGVAQATIDTIIKNSDGKIPFSSPSIYGLFITNLLSNLNRNTLRRKFTGLGLVLNPSHGRMQVYDINGKKALYSDILKEMYEFLNKSEYTPEELQLKDYLEKIPNSHQQVEQYLEYINPKQLVNSSDIQLLESYQEVIQDELGNETLGEIKTLLTPRDIQNLHSQNIQVYRVNKSRDLKPAEITWNENGMKKSIWTADALKISTNYFNELTKDEKVIADSYFKYRKLNIKQLTPKQQHLELQKWVQATFIKLREGTNFDNLDNFKFIDEKNKVNYDWNSYFNSSIPIENLSYKKAEVILPKIYNSIYGLDNHTLYEINKLGSNFFKNKLAINYDSKIPETDLLVRLKDKNIHIKIEDNSKINLEKNDLLYEDEIVNGKNIRYRLDTFGNRMYKIPTNLVIKKVNGIELFLVPNINDAETLVQGLKNQISSIDIISETNFAPKLNQLVKIARKYNNIRIYKDFYSNLDRLKTTKVGDKYISSKEDMNNYLNNVHSLIKDFYENKKDEKLQNHADSLYASFLKSLEVVSARIPSQALQSFMSMQNVGFVENGSSDGYVSIWQLYLQGSDLDIDKAYTIGHSIKNSGLYDGWSPLFDYSSIESLKESENLPRPNGIEINDNQINEIKNIEDLNKYNDLTYYINILNSGNQLLLSDWITLLKNIDYSKPFGYQSSNKGIENLVSYTNILNLINKINEHNLYNYTSDSIKNKIKRGIDYVIEDMRNQISAYSPISSGEYNDIAGKADKIKNIHDGNISIAETDEVNYDGKGTVGIMANGLKAFFSLTQYFNNYYQSNPELSKESPKYFQKHLNLNGKDYYLSSISDIKITDLQKETLRKYLKETFENEGDNYANIDLLFNENNADLNLSALTSLATDNAKELALSKLNAGIDLATFHVYLTILGLDPEVISNYMMTNPEVLDIKSKLNGNIFLSKSRSIDSIISKKYHPEFYKIYKGSRELRSLNSYLKLNQGTTSDVNEVHEMIQNMKNGLLNAENEYLNKDKELDIDKILENKPYLSLNYITNVINTAKSQDIIGKGIDIDKFANDDTNNGYANSVIKYYNLLKDTVNIYDVVKDLPHFNMMLKSFANQVKLGKQSFKFKFVENIVPEILEEAKKISSKVITVNNNPNYPAVYNKDLSRRAANFYDEYIISEFFKSEYLNKFNFNLSDISKMFNNDFIDYLDRGQVTSTKGQKVINLKSNDGIASFKLLMEKYFIPQFKSKLKNNEFIQNLVFLNNSYATKYKLSMNASNLNNPIMKNKADMIISGFDEISNLESGIQNSDKQDLSYGDLFFIYNTIVNKMRGGTDSLSIVFQNYAKDSNKLNYVMNIFYKKLEGLNFEHLSDIKFDELGLNPISTNDLLFALYSTSDNENKTLILSKNNKTIETEEELDNISDQDIKDLEAIKLSLPKKYYNFSIEVDNYKKTKSNSMIVNSIIDNLKSNIISLELNC